MLAKLIHFEFKSTYKLFLILIGAEFLLSIVLGISVNTNLHIMSERMAYDPFYTSNSSTVSFILVLMVVAFPQESIVWTGIFNAYITSNHLATCIK